MSGAPTHEGKMGPGQIIIDAYREPLGYQQITDLTSAVGLTVPAGASCAIIAPLTQDIRWRDDGTNPTDAAGMPLSAGVYYAYFGDLSAIKFIEQTASAELNVSYYGL